MLTLYETEIMDMPQVFLPFATDAKGQTLYAKVAQSKFLLEDGSNGSVRGNYGAIISVRAT